ncbi:hypothetical protein [Nocardia brevicatena]|uniref:hypothetical protein n=1 Tax=Nocardia brevicatena TaxID=37327 RepID=UPI000305392E|nr:hypothetical protein [Nocardia brevicatena]
MHNRTIVRIAATAAALGIGAGLGPTAPAAAEPTRPDTTASAPAKTALLTLADRTADNPKARDGVDALRKYTQLLDIAELRNVNSLFTPFSYPAVTFGCGSNGLITTTFASATANGPSTTFGRNSAPGTLTFHATPSHAGIPQNTGLTIAWININNGAAGLTTLDDRNASGLPSLSKTVPTGYGTVLASIWGPVDYPGALCMVTPTVGVFGVPPVPAATPTPAPTPGTPTSAPSPTPGPDPAPAPGPTPAETAPE